MIDVLLCFAIVLLLFVLFRKYWRTPPGPYGLPVIGYYPFLGEDPIESFHELSKRYGEIVSINLLGDTYWILNSVEVIEEAFVTKGDNFAGKSKTEYSLNKLFAKNTFGFSEGEEWKAQLKFVIGHLSQLGMGKSHYEVTIHNLLDNVEHYINSTNGEPHDYSNILRNFVLNVTTTMVCSKQYEADSQEYKRLMDWNQKLFSSIQYLNIILSGNGFKYFLKCKPQIERNVIDCYKLYVEYTRSLVEERTKTFDANNCQDLLDYWIKESSGPNREFFKYEYIGDNIAAMLLASQTPQMFLYHCLYQMASKPYIQKMVFKEIDETIGVDRDFCYLDKDRMPYTQAVISEIHRFVSFAPLGNVHSNRVATKLKGYDVPPRQKVIANIYTLSRDPKYFANPNEFDPNNFLDENGYFKPNKASIPFGVGVRKCLGMKLAEVEIFLAFVRLMRKFEWIQTDSTTTSIGSVRFLKPFKVSAKQRQ